MVDQDKWRNDRARESGGWHYYGRIVFNACSGILEAGGGIGVVGVVVEREVNDGQNRPRITHCLHSSVRALQRYDTATRTDDRSSAPQIFLNSTTSRHLFPPYLSISSRHIFRRIFSRHNLPWARHILDLGVPVPS